MPVDYELKSLKRAAVEWKSPWLEIAPQTAARIRDEIRKKKLDLTPNGTLDETVLAAVGVAAERLASLYQGSESDRLLAFALADFIENNYAPAWG